jgi:Transposase DDE domain
LTGWPSEERHPSDTCGAWATGWFFGFKGHFVINHKGEWLGVSLSAGNCDDRNPKVIRALVHQVKGYLVGDKGYLSKTLKEELAQQGITLLTKVRKNMKQQLLDPIEKLFLKKRALIESVFDLLKDRYHLEHSRHRSPRNFMVHFFAAICAYHFEENKPSLHFAQTELALCKQ